MRVPLITPLAARDGTVEKDERLVNCFGEQDIETKTTMVIKRAGIDEGDAVISGNDIYGQGLFNYDGYLFMMFGDVLGFWVYVGGSTMYGGGGGTYFNQSSYDTWDISTNYALDDTVFYDGQFWHAYIANVGQTPAYPYWSTTPAPVGTHPSVSYSGAKVTDSENPPTCEVHITSTITIKVGGVNYNSLVGTVSQVGTCASWTATYSDYWTSGNTIWNGYNTNFVPGNANEFIVATTIEQSYAYAEAQYYAHSIVI